MSAGPRIPYAIAKDAAAWLAGEWGLARFDGLVVGSVRRGRLDVGDIEFACRGVAPGERDDLFDAIAQTMGTDGLFGSGTVPMTREVRGFKLGFSAAALTVSLQHQETGLEIDNLPVQVNRWASDDSNRGWTTLRCTGPAEFGRWFLGRWKRRYGIPPEREASIDGRLVDRHGIVVPTPDEATCFSRLQIDFIPPEQRQQVAARAAERSRR